MSRNPTIFSCISGLCVVSVPVKGMEDLVLAVGGCSGRDLDKVEALGIQLCRPGWGSTPYAVAATGDDLTAGSSKRRQNKRQRAAQLRQGSLDEALSGAPHAVVRKFYYCLSAACDGSARSPLGATQPLWFFSCICPPSLDRHRLTKGACCF